LSAKSDDNTPPTFGEIEIEGDTAELAGFKTAVMEAAQRYNLQRARGEGTRRWMFLGVTGAGTRSLAIASLDEADGDDEIKGLLADQKPYACSLVIAGKPGLFDLFLIAKRGGEGRLSVRCDEEGQLEPLPTVPVDPPEFPTILQAMRPT
jgi:hypothetical protein